MKRKMTLVVLLAALCGFVMTGCNDNSSTTPPATNAPPKTNAPAH